MAKFSGMRPKEARFARIELVERSRSAEAARIIGYCPATAPRRRRRFSGVSVSRIASTMKGQAEKRFPKLSSALARARDVTLSDSRCAAACRYSSISSGVMGLTQNAGAMSWLNTSHNRCASSMSFSSIAAVSSYRIRIPENCSSLILCTARSNKLHFRTKVFSARRNALICHSSAGISEVFNSRDKQSDRSPFSK